VYGADRTVVNLIGSSPPGDDWLRILDVSIEFLRANYVPPIRVPPYAWKRFLIRTWFCCGVMVNTLSLIDPHGATRPRPMPARMETWYRSL
jgi:hypothetical protein